MVISSPAAQAQLKPNFVVRAQVTDDVGVVKVELYVDGKLFAARTTKPYDFPVTLAAGNHNLRVEGQDQATKKGVALVSVRVLSNQPGSPGAPPPPSGQTPPAGSFVYGMACTSGNQCSSGICANDLTLNQQYCTQTCSVDGSGCPTGSGCYPTSGSAYVCAPIVGGDTAGSVGNGGAAPSSDVQAVGAGFSCSVESGRGSPPLAPMVVLSVLLLGLALRRRRE